MPASAISAAALPGLVLLGLAVGFVAGMFGIGGGFLMTPLMVALFDVPLPIAVGTSLCQIIGTATATLLRHQKLSQGELRFDVLMLPGTVLGVEAGARVLAWLEGLGTATVAGHRAPIATVAIEAVYALVLLAVAAIYWRHAHSPPGHLNEARRGPLARVPLPPFVDLPAVPLARVSAPLVAYLGLAMGFLSGLIGIGGGVALMPVMLYGFGFPFRQAAGTGVLVLVATSVTGTIAHTLRGHVDLRLAMLLLVGSTLTAQLGALAVRRWPARALTRFHALVVVLAVAAVAWDVVRRFR